MPKERVDLNNVHQTLDNAYKVLQEAHAKYQQALAIAADTEWSEDEMLEIREQGRAFAEAVTRYSNAVLNCLGDVESKESQYRKPVAAHTRTT